MQSLRKFYPECQPVNLWRVRHKIKNQPGLDINPDTVGIINYESLKTLPLDFIHSFKHLILDESSKVKDPGVQITQFLAGMPSPSMKKPGISASFQYRLILSGTPAPNTPMEYWSQMAVIDRSILGENFYRFRSEHFYNPPRKFGQYIWLLKDGHEQQIVDAVKSRAFYISKKECLDLPDQNFITKTYQMDGPQLTAYKQMKKESVAVLKDTAVLGANEIAKIMKLRQITSGFIKTETGDSIFISDGKINLLKETLEEIGKNQVIIWCQFHYEIEKIKSILGEAAVTLYGDMGAQSNKDAAIEDFKSGKARYLIAHPKSGGMGLTFAQCAYNIYYSMDYSYEAFKQSEDRTHRIGQTKNVTYFILMAENSIDGLIYQAVMKKEKLSDSLLKMINEKGDTIEF